MWRTPRERLQAPEFLVRQFQRTPRQFHFFLQLARRMSSQTLERNGASQVPSSHPGLCTMIATTRNIFMGRKRKRIGQNPKSAEQGTGNAVKSNPSKRHRDRLNLEFDSLLSLLPTTDDVAGRLDKLSVLRLSVSCLRLKRFFEVTLGPGNRCRPADQPDIGRMDRLFTNLGNTVLSEGDLLLQALNGFVLVVTAEGDIFYASPTVQEYVGFHQTAVMHQPVFELIHPEYRDEFRRQLHWTLNPLPLSNMAQSGPGSSTMCEVVASYDPQRLPPENSSFLERNFVCKMRSLLNSPSGYVALNIEGRLKYLHGQNKRAEDGTLLPPQLALFAIATPLQLPSILEIRTRSALFQTKHKLDFSPVACDAKTKIVLGYSELELSMRGSGYQFIHADDMLYCADSHVRLMKTGESGLTIFRLLTKQNIWIWVQADARLVYKNGEPDCIIAKQRLLTDKEGIDHFQKRTMPFQLSFSTGEAVLYETCSPMLGLTNPFPSENGNANVEQNGCVDPNSPLGAMMSQDKSVYIRHPAVEPKYSLSRIGGAVGSGPGGNASCPQNGEENVTEEETSCKQDDDLLSILDDMLQSDNGERLTGLPDVLESLGPEDLELMHWVESTLSMEVDSECPLNDMLTNDQVLSYVHESLKKEMEGHSPRQPNSLWPSSGTRDQLAQCSDTSQRRANGSPRMPSLHMQQNASPSLPQLSARANYLAQEVVRPCSLAHSMQQQDLLQQQSMQWSHSMQQQMQTSSPMQQYMQQQVLHKQRATRPDPQLQQHLQQPHGQLLAPYRNQQSYHYTQQCSNPSPSPVSGLNSATTISHSISNGYMRAPQSCLVESQQNASLFNPPPNSASVPACVASSQQSRLDFSHPSIGLPSHGQDARNQTSWFPGANQSNGTAFPVFSSMPPHVGGKSADLSAFHSTSTVPLSHMNEYSHLQPEEQNGWRTVDLYKMKDDPNDIQGFHPNMNYTPIFGNGSVQKMYAGRRRKKPIKKTAKVESPEEVKSNPSRRHRERVNAELEQLAGLLPFPEEVTSKLDKLSVLRLTVSYLQARTFFDVALKNRRCPSVGNGAKGNNGQQALREVHLSEMELILQALDGFVVVITAEGDFFYTSQTIRDYLGFHQSDVLHQPVFEFIHTEDRHEFHRQLHWARNPTAVPQSDLVGQGESWPNVSITTGNPEQLPLENLSFLERNFVCRFRCLLDNSAGFQVLNIQGRLKFLHGQSKTAEDGSLAPAQFALFAIASPLQTPSILEIRTNSMIFRTKHKLDFTPMSCDAKGKVILGYSEAELCMQGTGYQFIHAADMLYCAENHVRMVKTGESGLTVFRLLTKEKRWTWVQANARLVYKNGRPDYIIATQRPLIDDEGEEYLSKRSLHLPFTYSTGEAVLYETGTFAPGLPDLHQVKRKDGKAKKSTGKFKHREKSERIDPNSLLGAMMKQDESVYVSHAATEPKCSFNAGFFNEIGKNDVKSRMEGIGPVSLGEQKTSYQDDGLLATLENLSENSRHNQVSVEIQSTLQDLGVEMKDLELLLLDERLMQVKIDPNYAPSLTDFLTNHEILSYVHDSLIKSSDGLDAVEEQASSATASKYPVHGQQYLQPRCSPIQQHQTPFQQVDPIQKSLLSSQVYMDNEGHCSGHQIYGSNQPDQSRQQLPQAVPTGQCNLQLQEMGVQQQQNNMQGSVQNTQQPMCIASDPFCNLQMQANRMGHNIQQQDQNLQRLHFFEHNVQHLCKSPYEQHTQSLQSHDACHPAVNVQQQLCSVPNHQQYCSPDSMQQCHANQCQRQSNRQGLQHCIQEGGENVQQQQNQTIQWWPQSVEETQRQECCNVPQWPKLGANMTDHESVKYYQIAAVMGHPKDKAGNLQVTWPESQQGTDTNHQQKNCVWFTHENCPFNSYGPEQPVNISRDQTAATHEWQMINPIETTFANYNSHRVVMDNTTYPSGSEDDIAVPSSSSCISAESFLQMMTEDQPTNDIIDILSAPAFQNENLP
uniref:uncharacterized protein n=1 Tax=Pristiophorus japonicus TaxID=55135 RepID=UPI00398F135B